MALAAARKNTPCASWSTSASTRCPRRRPWSCRLAAMCATAVTASAREYDWPWQIRLARGSARVPGCVSIEMSFMAASRAGSGGGFGGGQLGLQEAADVVAGVPVVALALVGAHAEALLDLLGELGQLGRVHVVGAIEARVHLELGRGQVDVGGRP